MRILRSVLNSRPVPVPNLALTTWPLFPARQPQDTSALAVPVRVELPTRAQSVIIRSIQWNIAMSPPRFEDADGSFVTVMPDAIYTPLIIAAKGSGGTNHPFLVDFGPGEQELPFVSLAVGLTGAMEFADRGADSIAGGLYLESGIEYAVVLGTPRYAMPGAIPMAANAVPSEPSGSGRACSVSDLTVHFDVIPYQDDQIVRSIGRPITPQGG